MKKTLFTALAFGLLFTSCVPRAALSSSLEQGDVIVEESGILTRIKHKVDFVEGTLPRTTIKNLTTGDEVIISQKVHHMELDSGYVFEIKTVLDGEYVSKVYFVDTRNVVWENDFSIRITSLAIGQGVDTLGTFVPGYGIQSVNFNNQPEMPVAIHPGKPAS